MKTRQEKKQDNVLDSDLNQMIHSIKNGQGWQTRGAEKMTYIDKMLMFGINTERRGCSIKVSVVYTGNDGLSTLIRNAID